MWNKLEVKATLSFTSIYLHSQGRILAMIRTKLYYDLHIQGI